MKILLLGKNGQVGWELQRALAPLGELIALDRNGTAGLVGDLSYPEALRDVVRKTAPDIIVNAAAYTAVDRAETEIDLAKTINTDAVRILAEEAKILNALFVHYSTDYVFPGSGQMPWKETDATAPLSIYGKTKRAGEEAILASGCTYLIFRTSWVFAARGHNFIKTMLRLGQDRTQLSVVCDQIGAPTGAELIADVTAHAIRSVALDPAKAGIYHLAASGAASWHEFAEYIFVQARGMGVPLAVQSVAPVPTVEYPTPASRPLNSRLDTAKIATMFGLAMPVWQNGVSRVLAELLERTT
ncbi:dTDP-4-dehydrorhamnose reductase [Halothiobacillus sp. DCM-1]|uniref:dTDP-4-dehydrorhamnose reductase n=1 Tax=Halothiobacillus sp. DCM-1 TaxID=3112558 RepID=UPI00324CE04A